MELKTVMATKSKSAKATKPAKTKTGASGGDEFVPVIEVAAEFEPEFLEGVRTDVIPILVEEGLLTGKGVKGETLIKRDAAFERLMQFGIERFAYGQQGWSFVAFKAPIDAVAEAMRKRKDVSDYRKDVGAIKSKTGTPAAFESEKRHLFVVRFPENDWTVVIISVHWFTEIESKIGMDLAEGLSKTLSCRAIAGMDHDTCGSWAVVFEKGKKTAGFSTEEDLPQFYALYYREALFLPQCFPAKGKDGASLMSDDPDAFERVDHLLIEAPAA
jgi:hypothetical protein